MSNELHSPIYLNEAGVVSGQKGDLGYGFGNLILNGDMTHWQDSDARPCAWGATESRLTISKETSGVKIGRNAAKFTCNDAAGASDSTAYYTIPSWFSNWGYLKGRNLTVGLWYYCPSTNDMTQKISLQDGIGNTTSNALTCDNAWHYLTVTRAINSSATTIIVKVIAKSESTADTDDYVIIDGLCAYEGKVAAKWTPNPRDLIQHHAFTPLMNLASNDMQPIFTNQRGHSLKIVHAGYWVYGTVSGSPILDIGLIDSSATSYNDTYYAAIGVGAYNKGKQVGFTGSLNYTQLQDGDSIYGYIGTTGGGSVVVGLEMLDYY